MNDDRNKITAGGAILARLRAVGVDYIFAQLTDFLPQRVFDRLVSKYDGNKHVRHFSCWNQLLSMIFGQLTGRDSLRDLMVSIEPHKPKFYHLGFGKGTSRSNFAKANENRDCRIFEEYAFYLIDLARKFSIAVSLRSGTSSTG